MSATEHKEISITLDSKKIIIISIILLASIFSSLTYFQALFAFISPSQDYPLDITGVSTHDTANNPKTSFYIGYTVRIKTIVEYATDYYAFLPTNYTYFNFVGPVTYKINYTVTDGSNNPVTFPETVQTISPGSSQETIYDYTIASGSGTYTVTVMVWDTSGNPLTQDNRTVTFTASTKPTPPRPPPYIPPPTNIPPIARAAGAIKGFTNRTIHFNGLGSTDQDGTIIFYLWDFGDGTSDTGGQVTHAFTEAGVYLVNLTVIDNGNAAGWDAQNVTIRDPPIPPKWGLDKGVGPDEKNFLVNATDVANTTVTVNTTSQVTIYVLNYPGNPHPEVPMPPKSLDTIIDIDLTDPDAVDWPIYVERTYTDEEIAGLEESKLGIYYYKEGAWHRCRKTGVKAGQNIAWAWMYRDEVTGSPTLIGALPAVAAFELSDLSITPLEIIPGDEINISVTITNVGDEAGNYTITLRIDDVTEGTETVTLEGLSSTTVTFTTTKSLEDTYSVEVDGLSGSFTVIKPTQAEFTVSNLKISPTEVEPDEDVTIEVIVRNIGQLSGDYAVELELDGTVIDIANVTLSGGASTTIKYTISSAVEGAHAVKVDRVSGSFTVTKRLAPAEFEVTDLVVSPSEREQGSTTNISASVQVTNIGEQSGTILVEFELDGSVLDIKELTLDGGETSSVSSTTSSDVLGTHTIEVHGLTGEFMVTEPTKPINWLIIDVIIIVLVAVAVYLYSRKRNTAASNST